MNKISIKAILIGLTLLQSSYFIQPYINLAKDYAYKQYRDELFSHEQAMLFQIIIAATIFFIGLLTNGITGYIVARIAKTKELTHSILVGSIAIILSPITTYFIYKYTIFESFDFVHLIGILIYILEIVLGAYIFKRHKEKKMAT